MKDKLWTRDFIIACLMYFLQACSFTLLIPTIPLFLTEVLDVETTKVGIVLSSYVLALLLIRPFSGYLVDNYPRKPLLIIGLTLFVATYIGYYFAFTVIFFIILRFIHGAFWGLATVSANTVAIDIIPASRRSEGIGYFGVNSNIATAIAPYIGVNIYENYGFDTLISAALLMGTLSIIVVSFIRTPKREKSDEIPPVSLDRFILVKGIPILINQIFLAFGWGALAAFAVLYGKEIGIQNAGIYFVFLAVGIVLSRLFSGKLVDRGYLHQMMYAAIILITIGYIGFALLQTIVFYCLTAFFIGLGYGTLFPALQTIYINMAPHTKRGTANSTYLTGFDLGIGLGMLVSAFLEGKFGFSSMFLIVAGIAFVGLIIYVFNSKRVYEQNKLVGD